MYTCAICLVCLTQILGQFAEAVSEYRDLLNIYPDYVPALKGSYAWLHVRSIFSLFCAIDALFQCTHSAVK